MARFSLRIFSCCLLLFSLPSLSGFSQSYNFRNYSVEEGLPFIGVSAICQDIKGNLWVGGYGGLSKFNGQTFVNFSPRNGLVNHRVLCLASDTTGQLWVGTQAGLSRMTDRGFINYSVKDGLPDDRINCLMCDSKNRIWIGTGKGICIFEAGVMKPLQYAKDNPARDVQSLFEDASHRVWIGTNKGIVIVMPDGRTRSLAGPKNGLESADVHSVFQDREGKYWVCTAKGVIYLDANYDKAPVTAALNGINVINAIQDLEGNIWISTELGLWKYNGKEFRSISLGREINANKTGCLFQDYEKNIWVGTYSGLFRYRSANFLSYGQSEGLNTPFIFQITKDRNENLWVGTFGGGLSIYKNDKFYNFTQADGLPGNNVSSVIQASDGTMWVGTDQGLATCKPLIDPLKRPHFEQPGLKNKLHCDSVNAIFQDSKGVIWVGGNSGITRIDAGTYTWLPLPDGKTTFSVYFFMEDRKGYLWIGTYLGGLYRYDGKVFERMNEKLGLKSESSLAMKQDKDGIYYFGSFEGVYVYDPSGHYIKDGKMLQLSEADGMNSDLVYLMEFADEEETLWVGTNQGLNKVDLGYWKHSGKKRIISYGKEEGFTGVECNGSAVYHETNGCMWFGTVNGLIHYDPGANKPNLIPAKTGITRIRLFYADTLLRKDAGMAYDENNLSFEYIGICLTNPQKVRYKVKLEGFDKDWSPVTASTIATYSNLPSGSYTFHVLSCNNAGVWSAAPVNFSFRIKAPFWKTIWFSVLLALTIVALVVIGLRIRINTIRRNEQVKVRLATNELKALRSQMNPHFIFNSLNSIQHFIMSNDENSAAKYLNTFAKLIRTILNNSEKPVVSIREEIDSLKLYLQLEALRFESKFEYEITTDPNLDIDYHEVPTMLIQPFAENAIIHGLLPKKGLGRLDIRIVREGNFTLCTITDNGIGRRKAMELKDNSVRKTHKSFGMKITQDRLELLNFIHNSSLSIRVTDLTDEKGSASGTRVDIYIPMI